jgi:hypothetical protein
LSDKYVIDPGDNVTAVPEWESLLRIGSLQLFLASSGDFKLENVVSYTPVVAVRRELVGVDSSISTNDRLHKQLLENSVQEVAARADRAKQEVEEAIPETDSASMDRILGWPHGIGAREARSLPLKSGIDVRVKVAIIDLSFASAGTFDPAVLTILDPSNLLHAVEGLPDPTPPGHGAVMARAVRKVAPSVDLLFCPLTRRRPLETSYSAGLLINLDIAVQLSEAASKGARIILIALSGGDWGVPPYLAELLWRLEEEGVLVITATGLGTENHSESTDSWLLSNDDLQSHPSVVTLAGADSQGRWARRDDAPISCFGVGIDLAGPGDVFTVADGTSHTVVDDTSLAAALLAGTAALVLRLAPNLRPFEIRQLLRIGARRPAVVDDEVRSLDCASALFNDWDRSGHNLKLGYGNLDALQTCLAAADPVCLVLLATRAQPDSAAPLATRMARAWMSFVESVEQQSELGGQYSTQRAALVELVLRSPRVFEVSSRLARHLRELVADPSQRWVTDALIDKQPIPGHECLRTMICDILRVVRMHDPDGGQGNLAKWSVYCAKNLPDAGAIKACLASMFREQN